KTEVPGEYRLVDATVSFQLGDFDPALPLVIDPVFSFSTYVGGISDDSGWDVSTDQAGNIYITGETLSPWMATAGAFRPYFSGGTAASGGDAFVAKFDPSGTRLFYLTYLGGTGNDGASALAVDASGAVYVTGVTDSPDFPMAFPIKWFISGDINPYLPLYPYDAFVSKIDPSGSRLIYSTYLGGRGSDQAMDIAVDSQGSAYVTGFTQSGDFPTSRFSRKFAGKSDAFIAKLTPNGRNFAYSIFLGGRGSDRAHAIVLDAEQQATIVGFTDSTTFPLTNAFQTFLAGGKDAFFATVSRDGSRLLQSTYWGGLGDDIAYDAALDQTGTLHVTGSQSGLGFPIIPGNLNPGGVFKTLDGGDAWQAANTGLLHPDVRNIALSPSHPSIVYLDTWRGIFRSSDAGQSWAPVLPSVVKTPRSMVVSPENPDVLYATSGSRVLITTNGGSSWFFSAKGLPQVKVTKVLPVPGSGSIIYAATALGVYRSTNAAASWRYSSRGLGAQAVHDLVISPADPSVLYASTSAGVYRSTDAGASWSRANKGLRTAILRSLSPDPQNPLTVYGGASAGGILKPGLFKTTNGGSNWVTVSIVDSNTNLLAGNVHVTSIVVEPADSSIVYIGSTRGVFKSLDQGAHWTALTNGFTVSHITSLAVASQNPGTLYVGTIGRGSFGASDAFVTRFGSSFHSMSFGGKNVDQPLAIAADAQGNSFVTGTTASLNFPTKAPTSALSSSNRGGYDAFVTVINPEGSAFVYSGFLGGRGSDKAMGISLDADENPVLVGRTSSANFPVARPFRSTRTGASDAFITRLLNVE
ncbi:MAG TPA: SBBP repeat-containing protein, partial [Clostridia bacterium]|nr:SBBP repeat-containing protein [Clostridia bacterium]